MGSAHLAQFLRALVDAFLAKLLAGTTSLNKVDQVDDVGLRFALAKPLKLPTDPQADHGSLADLLTLDALDGGASLEGTVKVLDFGAVFSAPGTAANVDFNSQTDAT